MRNALALMSRQHSLVPAFGLEPPRFIDGKPRVVANLNALPVIDIFMREIAPLARQIHLGEGWTRRQHCRQYQGSAHMHPHRLVRRV